VRRAEAAAAEAAAAEAARAEAKLKHAAEMRQVEAAAASASVAEEGEQAGGHAAWDVSAADKDKFDAIFAQMGPENGHVGGAKAAPVLKRSGLQQGLLRDIWSLVDVKKDGLLDSDWFAVAMHLTMKAKRGQPLPDTLPRDLVPPKDR
jgi:hypothetical protein